MRKDVKLSDMVKKIPQGGLLNPGLRHINTDVTHIKPLKTPKSGNFRNVLGR